MTQPRNPNKDEWIQRAKELMYRAYHEVDSKETETELRDLIKEGGGFDPSVETANSKLKWRSPVG